MSKLYVITYSDYDTYFFYAAVTSKEIADELIDACDNKEQHIDVEELPVFDSADQFREWYKKTYNSKWDSKRLEKAHNKGG